MGDFDVVGEFVKFGSLLIIDVGILLLRNSIVLFVMEECAVTNGFSEVDFEVKGAFPPVKGCKVTFGAS
jgi:hypothetical protein